ncbi:CDP-glycerol glycerophosphotransferase family protein [Microbacterium sp. YY-01]|uniref:CDP-glycerol glycerophosphotransferase family protein n=1 Tax=Microbacterium sp. YY-01 TaxID=3421634 RepID=UPI003D180A85
MTSVRVDEESASIIVSGVGARPDWAVLEGPRARVEAKLTGRGKTWRALFVLRAARWGGPELPLPSGSYRLAIAGVDLAAENTAVDALLPSLLVTVRGDDVTISPPIDPRLASADGQRTLEARYGWQAGATENAVFFESFYGFSTGCNPQALDREIARRAPEITRYWSVTDYSVPVPEGAVAVVEGSAQWWRARSESRLLIVNDWLRRRYVRKKGQRVLQTWHGTPLKRLALHRPGFDPRRMVAVIRESRRWDILLAQNAYAARILQKAYAFFRRTLWVEGYPRNDVLVTGTADGTAAAVRQSLGIGAEERVVMYAPTWRDDRTEIVDFIDLEKLARDTDAVVLVRGHSRTLTHGKDQSGARVIDVTGFSDTSLLLLIADALITDYSSVMFDFSVTGRPLYFLVPDLEHYRGELRGFYFDLSERAPGPLVSTQNELTEALNDPAVSQNFAQKYAAWRAQFNSLDDGQAASRVVDRLFDQGYLRR